MSAKTSLQMKLLLAGVAFFALTIVTIVLHQSTKKEVWYLVRIQKHDGVPVYTVESESGATWSFSFSKDRTLVLEYPSGRRRPELIEFCADLQAQYDQFIAEGFYPTEIQDQRMIKDRVSLLDD